MNEASFAHDGWFEAKCFWCGIPAAVGEKVEIIEYSRREAYWMHPNCARLYVEALGNPKACDGLSLPSRSAIGIPVRTHTFATTLAPN